jgi:hypothetical protein
MLALRPVAPWARAAKLVRADGTVEPYRLGREFVGTETNWRTAAEAFDGLDALRHQPTICLVRGAMIPGAPVPFPRRYLGDQRAIAPAPRQLLGVDFDDIGPAESVAEAAAIAIRKLPSELRAGPVRVNLTASASRQNARCRVWLWLAKPAGDRAVRAAMRGVSDVSLYSPVQPHYTADAVRETPDPWPDRVWRDDLGGEATLGAVDDLAVQAVELLQIHEKRVRLAKEGARHPKLNAAAYVLGRYVASGLIEHDRVRETLVAAAMVAKLEAQRATDEVDRAMRDATGKPITDAAWRARLARDASSGATKTSETNALAVLTNDPAWADRMALDLSTRDVVWIDPPPGSKPGPIPEAEHLLVAQAIERDHRLTFSTATIGAALATAAHLAPVDPVREWLDDQPWDGVPRIDDALIEHLGAEPSDYVRAASRAFFVSFAARILRPGCQVDLCLVLSGLQGCGKTSFLRDVGGPWYAELADMASDDAVYTLARAALIELGELSALQRAELERTKAFVSRTADTYRPKYGRSAVTLPRRCIFAGTTNLDGYLSDPTGNRRWLPVAVRRYDRTRALEAMPFLLGEARERAAAGEAFHDVPGAVDAQRAQLTVDPWIELIAAGMGDRGAVTIRDLLLVLGVASDRANAQTSRRLALAMQALGWNRDGAVWRRPVAP